jgi:DNA polymerase-4
MPTHQAVALCPQVILQPHRFDAYREASERIQAIFLQYTDVIEPLSLDEAFMDVSDSDLFSGSATLLAEHIRQQVFKEVGITVSAGIAPNKFLAKVASDWNKPNGSFTISPNHVERFVQQLPVKKIFGVGKKSAERLKSLGIETCGDLQGHSINELINRYGKSGLRLYELSRGIDNRPVSNSRTRKSLSIEHTFNKNLPTLGTCLSKLPYLFESLMERLKKKQDLAVRSLFLKIKYADFRQTTIERCLPLDPESYQSLLLSALKENHQPVRLMGLGVRFRDEDKNQMQLF